MAANALKDSTKLSSTICRMSPPSSPSRTRARSASYTATTSVTRPPLSKPKSKILALLDAEIPNWLSGTSSASLAEGGKSLATNASLAVPEPTLAHPFFTNSQSSTGPIRPAPRVRSRTAPTTSTMAKGKARATAATAILEDVENHPQTAEDTIVPATIPLPPYSYKDYTPTPAVVYTPDEEEANDLVQCLRGPVLGFDLEWVVLFRRGKTPTNHRTALVQLCDSRMILLVQVSAMKKFPEKVKEIIESKDIVKVGANIKNDGQKLFNDYGILARNLVELGAMARQADPAFSKVYKRSIVSLARVVEMYTQKTLAKGKVRTSNWEKTPLSEEQKFYAANDAHCALMVYNRLLEIAAERGVTVDTELCGADLAQEYQRKVAAASAVDAGHTLLAGPSMESPSTATTASTAEPTSGTASGPSTSQHKPRSATYSRPLVYMGERSSRPPSSTGPNTATSTPTTTTTTSATSAGPREPPRPQHMRAYNLWHNRNMALRDICAALRSKDNPLAESTVISYVVRALQADPSLPFSMERLKAFVQLEAGSWARHRDWILQMDGYAK
ncbi:ribonuclease H-like domain-containing protein [Cubamyces menziesii]|nr:ribonuclease H-like domain-containing protein [Cubamyces menziesii]